MHEAIAIYFSGEKNAGLILAAIALVMGVGAAVFFQSGAQLRPFAITLGVWAALELAVGVGLYAKTGPQQEALARALRDDPPAFYAAERPRMVKVQRNFVIIEAVWLALILGAAPFSILQKGNPVWSGVALGMLVNLAVLLSFDLIAERRGAVYLAALTGP